MNILEAYIFGQKILGMNARNLSYIKPFNKRKWIKLVDDKIRFKNRLQKNEIPTPKLIASIRSFEELNNFDFGSLPKSFVLKPRSGFGGDGIIVIFGESKKRGINAERVWIKGRQVRVSEYELRNHIKNILDGTFSRNNTPDVAFFEERIQLSKTFKPYAYKGIPDIRVVVFNRVPVMAMLRLPTRESGGKANLHQGGIGLGIDLATGVTTNAIQGNRFVETLPNKRVPLAGIKIPYWDSVLDIAVRTADITHLGFAGIDIAIDRELGPVVLEANARPGMNIQLANLAPLKERLEKVKGLKIKTTKRAIRLSKDLFGGEIEEEIEEITGRTVIGLRETVDITSATGEVIKVDCKVDTGADSSSIDEALVRQLGFGQVFEEFKKLKIQSDITKMHLNQRLDYIHSLNQQIDKTDYTLLEKVDTVRAGNGISIRPYIKLQCKVQDATIQAICSITNRSHLNFPMLLGNKNMKKFIIDPVKK